MYKLFKWMADEHDLILLGSELKDIIFIVENLNEKTMNKKKTAVQLETAKKQYAILKGKGMLQREIAKELKVSCKTVSRWAKTLPIGSYFVIRNGLQNRLITMLKDNNSPSIDIYNLQNSIASIEKIITKYTKPE